MLLLATSRDTGFCLGRDQQDWGEVIATLSNSAKAPALRFCSSFPFEQGSAKTREVRMFEYAISAGEGTLLSFGTLTPRDEDLIDFLAPDETLVIAPCDTDCETGK